MAKGVGSGANYTGHKLAEGVGSGRWSGNEGIMLFNERNDAFDSCILTSGSELWLFLLSINVNNSCVQSVSGDLGGCVCASTWNKNRVKLENATRQVCGCMRWHYNVPQHSLPIKWPSNSSYGSLDSRMRTVQSTVQLLYNLDFHFFIIRDNNMPKINVHVLISIVNNQ